MTELDMVQGVGTPLANRGAAAAPSPSRDRSGRACRGAA